MARKRHLVNPPIREAVLDIRIPQQDCVDPNSLRKALDSVGGFPDVQDLKRESLTIQLSPEGSPQSHVEDQVAGVRGTTDDGLWIVQYRQDGMTFSRLAPYCHWEALSEKARPLASTFLRVTEAPHVERLALRYINHFRLPNRDPTQYFVSLPSFPETLPLGVENFVSRITAREYVEDLSVHVTHARLDDLAPDRAGFILDIDAFAATKVSPDVDQFWGTFDRLRNLKNKVFFNLITERNAELYE